MQFKEHINVTDLEFIQVEDIRIRVDTEIAEYFATRRGGSNPVLATFLIVEPEHQEDEEGFLLIFGAGQSKVPHESLLMAGELLELLDTNAQVYGGGAVDLLSKRYDHDSIDYKAVKVDKTRPNINQTVIEKVTDYLIDVYS